MSIFPKSLKIPQAVKTKTVNMRDFGGGWNAVDDDISMSTRFQRTLINFKRTASGAVALRTGTQWFADIASTVNGDIVDMQYFNGRLIAITSLGEISATDDDGTTTVIWNTALAALQPSAPDGWSAGLDSIDFVPFKRVLIVHNGIDKPVSISTAFVVSYLQDGATGSNVNVPIGKYGCVVANYHVIAGIPASPTTLYIASKGTDGTFQGAPDPNDSISLDVGAYAPDSGSEIRGIAGFRNNLIVFFRGQSLIITLGEYDADGVHVPSYRDTLPAFGLMGHRCIIPVENDLLFADTTGLNSAKRNLFSGLVDSEQLSAIVGPQWRGTMGAQAEDAMLKSTFMVHDKLGNAVLVFSSDNRIFTYTTSEKLRFKAWSEYQGWAWSCACTSFLGRVFFASGSKIFQLGNMDFGENYTADKQNDHDSTWINATDYVEGDLIYDSVLATSYHCSVNHTSATTGTFAQDREATPENWDEYLGEEIAFEFEPPWQDGRDAIKTKKMTHLMIQSKGTAEFTCQIYVDNLQLDQDGELYLHDPALALPMVGNDSPGFGYDDEEESGFGGGRRSGDPRLYGFPLRFKLAKFRIIGGTRRPLTIIGISFLYSMRAFKR